MGAVGNVLIFIVIIIVPAQGLRLRVGFRLGHGRAVQFQNLMKKVIEALCVVMVMAGAGLCRPAAETNGTVQPMPSLSAPDRKSVV